MNIGVQTEIKVLQLTANIGRVQQSTKSPAKEKEDPRKLRERE